MKRDSLEYILDVSRRMAETRDLIPLLNYVVDEAIQLVGAERGYVVLVQSDGTLNFRVQRGQDGQVLENGRDQISQSVLRQVIETGQPLVLRDAAQDPHFREAESVVILGLRSIMCVPLIAQGNTIGAIYAENRSIRGRFSEKDVYPLVPFANQAAVAIENTHLFQAQQQAFDALRTSEEKFRSLFEDSQDTIFITTPEGQIVDINPAGIRLFGYTDEEIVSMTAMDFYVSPDDRLRFQRTIEQYGAVEGFEVRLRRKDGTEIDALLTATAQRAADGTIAGYQGIVRDITKSKRAEEELRKHRDHLEELIVERTIKLEKEITERKQAEDLLRAQRDLGLALGAAVGLGETLRLCVETAMHVSEMDYGEAYLFDEASGSIDLAFHKGLPAEFIESASHYDADSFNARLIKTGKPVYARYQDLGVPLHEPVRREGLRAIAIIPVLYEGRVIAYLNVASHTLDEVPDFARTALETIATQIGSAIVRSKAEEGQRKALAKALEATRALRQSQADLQTLFDSLEDFLFVLDMEGRILDLNPVMLKRLGYSKAELLGKSVLKVHPPDRREEAATIVADMVAGRTDYCPIPVMAKDGTLIPVETKITHGHWGGREALFGISRDIAERKRAEEALQGSEEKFRSLAENSQDYIMRYDRQCRHLYENPAALRVSGFTEEDIIGKTHREAGFEEELSDLWEERITRVFETGEPSQYTFAWESVEGKVYLDWRLFPEFDQDGNVKTVLGISRDITELKQAEEELRWAKEAAEAANRAKSVFLANMSHELRTPLNAILGFGELMARDPDLTREQQERLATIGRSGEHLLALINDVLELSKIEAGRVELQPESFDLHRMLLGLGEMFSLRAEAKDLSLVFDLAPGVPQYIRADRGKLRQVLINLLGNAVKFTHEGGITLRVRSREYEVRAKDVSSTPLFPTPDSLLHFEVEDTGVGIRPDELHQVFDAFAQTTSGQASREGSGLGMPISREFVRIMGGDLTISSEVGVGTVFQFDVPVEVVDAVEVESPQPPRRVVGLEPGQRAADGGPYRLLVVEDVDANRKLLVEMLRPFADPTGSQGFEVREAINGREAVEMWQEWKPHLIWMDIRMPVLDGLEATRRIKAQAQAGDRSAPIIVALTASPFEEERERVLSEGCDDFIRKPVRGADIFDALTRHLGVRFVYEEIERGDRDVQKELEITDLKSRISDLPLDLLTDLKYATVVGDIHQILNLIDRIHTHDPAVAGALARLANDFQHTRILTLIQGATGGQDE